MSWKNVDKDKVLKLITNDLGEEAVIFLKNKKLFVNSSMPMEVVGLSNELSKVFDSIKKKGIQPLFMGEYLIDTKDFKRSRLKLPLAYKAAKLKLPKAYVKPKGEQLFLYSRDIISDSVIKTEGEIKPNKPVFVLNQYNELLGIGLSKGELTRKGKSTVIKHIIDIGHYLRVER